MGFFGGQHKFSGWVGAVTSANMLVWILVPLLRRGRRSLAGMLALACTFFPAWIRPFRKG